MAFEQVHRFGRRSRFATPSRRRRMRGWIAAGLCMGFAAVVWAWAFQRGPGEAGSGVPLLVADHQPTREKPTDPGGLKVNPDDPLSYDSGRTPPRVENILPGPEKPLPQPEPEKHTVATAPPAPTDTQPGAANAATPQQQIQIADNTQAVGPPLKLVPNEPQATAKPAAAVTSVPAPAAKPKPAPPAAKPKAQTAQPKPAKPEAKPMAVGAGGYRVQLASLKSAADARQVGDRLKRTYGEILGAVSLSVTQVNLGERGIYFRVMAGPMSQSSASQICDSLKQRGAACLLAKP